MRIIFIGCFLVSSILMAQITFDADFESGNLNSVSTSDSINYTVTTVSDIGGRWFYFRINGVRNKFLRVNIPTSDVNRPLYSYDNRNFTRFTGSESPQVNVFQKTFSEDTVYVAYYYPYTFTYLQERIKEWQKNLFVTVDTTGYTDRGFPIQEIMITDPAGGDEYKYHVWIHARTHPGETPSSWHFDGIVKVLLENDEVIEYYRKEIVFHLIPFTNPDGVYYGRSRTNYDGVDVERDWDKPEEETCSEVQILRKRMVEINNQKALSVFLNLHSLASPQCTFYIHTPGSTSEHFYRREYQFVNLNSSDNPYFTKPDYSESSLNSYFPEGWLWNNHGESVMALTYETPYNQYSNNKWVTNDNLFEIGFRTVYSIAEYLEISHPKHYILDNRQIFASGPWQSDTTGLEFFGADFLLIPPGEGNNSISYLTEPLDAGVYDIYGWWPSSQQYSFNTRFKIESDTNITYIDKTQRTNGGQWNYLAEVSLNRNSPIEISVDQNPSGYVAADAFRIVYRGPVVKIDKLIIPAGFTLSQNYPNPFNPTTTIRFNLYRGARVELKVFNALGQLVGELVNGELGSGLHEIIFDTREYRLASGVYYYNLTANNFSETKAMVLLK